MKFKKGDIICYIYDQDYLCEVIKLDKIRNNYVLKNLSTKGEEETFYILVETFYEKSEITKTKLWNVLK